MSDAPTHPLRAFRQKKGMSLEDVAASTGTSKAQLSRVENWRQDPTLELIRRLSKLSGGKLKANDFVRQDSNA